MGTTSNQSYPYPEGSDPVDVPGDIQSLADAVDADVAAVIAGTGLADGAVTTAKLADGAVTFAKTSGVAPATALRLPGTSGNWVTAPDAAALDITGDIEIIVKVGLDNWASGANQALVSKRTVDTATDLAYLFYIGAGGTARFAWYDSGTSAYRELATGSLGYAANTTKWLRVKFDADTGSGCRATFEDSDDGITWSSIAAPTNGTTAAIRATTALLNIGGTNSIGAETIKGQLHLAEIKDGIGGTTVAKFDARAPMGPRYTDPQGNVWTINGSAWSWSRA